MKYRKIICPLIGGAGGALLAMNASKLDTVKGTILFIAGIAAVVAAAFLNTQKTDDGDKE